MFNSNHKLPLRHISIRVPWHDALWQGTVCKYPHLNESCLRLPRISEHRSNPKLQNQCEKVADQSIETLDEKDWPCCVPERGMFMAPFEYTRIAEHPYVRMNSKSHGHFLPTPIRYPAYSAAAIPFNWMFRENMEKYEQDYGIDVDFNHEPDLGFSTIWIQDYRNHKALFECCFGHLKPEQSLCFFYAKEVPFVEDARRVIVGVGRVLHVSQAIEYNYKRGPAGDDLRSLLWEHMIQHSIRPDFKDGFLLPYDDLLPRFDEVMTLNPSDFTAFTPEQYFDEFSYASELVSHDAAIEALLSCEAVLTRTNSLLDKSWDSQIKWIHDRIAEMWKMRGPCPGLGAVLCAFGIEYGVYIAREIETLVSENEDPWPVLNNALKDPSRVLSQKGAQLLSRDMCRKWEVLPADRRSLLKLMSRFNLQPDQAELLYVKEERERKGITISDSDLINNPYLIYEATRLKENPASLRIIDRGVFPDKIVREKHPLPDPSAIDGGVDSRRIRAFIVDQLERAASEGHTLQRKADIVRAIRDLDIRPACPVDEDQLLVTEPHLKEVVMKSKLKDDSDYYQLNRLADMGKVIRDSINKRIKGKPHQLNVDWRRLLDETLGAIGEQLDQDREQEERARVEKAAALKVLAESRISVLVGPAGTGKTTLLSVLCGQEEISRGEILLLAPTGKARVRMEQATRGYGLKIKGYTIAQFLNSCGRYDGTTGRYQLSNDPKVTPAKTVIIDECSMLTEEMLAATMDALQGVERLVLVGDPRQLPPIGAGRPFVDIVSKLAPATAHNIFPCIGPNYAELTVLRRQAGAQREDVGLARWFSGVPVPPGEDEFLDRVLYNDVSKNIDFKEWNTPDELQKKLMDTIVEELGLDAPDDIAGFDKMLGGKEFNGNMYFNRGAAKSMENWQILSPVRKKPHGVSLINRLIHDRFRAGMLEFARREPKWAKKISAPMGPEQIVYGDKVINIRNHRRNKVYPSEDAIAYLANGEIGIAVGQFKTKKMKKPPWLLKVEFSSQTGYQYDFSKNDFGDEATPYLELAYALTVHKAQGSDFEIVILVLPNPCRLLSRELIYTALTRQRKRLVILHQGNRSVLRAFSGGAYSESAKRLTNLLVEPLPVEYSGVFYEQNMIHRTLRGEMVRSKSELLIADRLHTHNIDYIYEQPLAIGGQTRFPDFTIDDAESGIKFYWEHCGMLYDPFYNARWERKLNWYKQNDILPIGEGGGRNGTLIITRDSERGGISSQEIEDCIKEMQNY